MDRGTHKVKRCEIQQGFEYSMEINDIRYVVPELPHLAHISKTSLSGDPTLREYPLALEKMVYLMLARIWRNGAYLFFFKYAKAI